MGSSRLRRWRKKKKAAASFAVVGDFNGDGRAAILTPGKTSSTLLLGGADGAPTAVRVGVALPPKFSPKIFFVADFDGDGISDLVMTDKKLAVAVLLGVVDSMMKLK